MTFPRALALASLLLVPSLLQAAPSKRSTTPADRLSEPWWAARHASAVAAAKAHPETELLLVGDSITNNYDKANPPDENFQPTWQTFYAPRHALNLGFSGDATEHVLWRITHGEVDGLHPKAIVLLIGVNNIGHEHQSAQETELGIDAILGTLELKMPQAKILLLGVLPADPGQPWASTTLELNRRLASVDGVNPRVTFLDIGSVFFSKGAFRTDLFYDPRLPKPAFALHPDTNGQRMMAEAIEPTLAKLMGDAPRVPLTSTTDIDTAILPVPRLEQDGYEWYARHTAELLTQSTMQPDVVLIGDSITHFWEGPPYEGSRRSGTQSWQKVFGNLSVLNMGFGWDRTQNVLWRMEHGEFQGVTPRWVVLNIGTNNLTGSANARASTPEEVVEGIAAICALVHQRSPNTKILLMKVFPRGAKPDSPYRPPILAVNKLIDARFASDPTIRILDINAKMLTPEGVITKEMMPDGTHPSEIGYDLWADALITAGLKP